MCINVFKYMIRPKHCSTESFPKLTDFTCFTFVYCVNTTFLNLVLDLEHAPD